MWGWVNYYFRLVEVKGIFGELDGWVRRKFRCILVAAVEEALSGQPPLRAYTFLKPISISFRAAPALVPSFGQAQ